MIWHTFLSVHRKEVDVIQIQHEQNAKRNGGALGVLSCAEMLLEPLNKTTHHVHGNVLHFTPGSIREDYLLVATQFLLALSSMSKNLTFFLCRVHVLIMVFASHPVDTGQSRQTLLGASTGIPQHDLPVALRYCIVREIQVAALSITCIAIRTAWRILQIMQRHLQDNSPCSANACNQLQDPTASVSHVPAVSARSRRLRPNFR